MRHCGGGKKVAARHHVNKHLSLAEHFCCYVTWSSLFRTPPPSVQGHHASHRLNSWLKYHSSIEKWWCGWAVYISPQRRDNWAIEQSLWQIPWWIIFIPVCDKDRPLEAILILTVFAYCQKRAYKCKEIDVTIFKLCLKVYPQDKILLTIKIHKWDGL